MNSYQSLHLELMDRVFNIIPSGFILIMIIMMSLTLRYWEGISNYFSIKPYRKIQRVHENEVPRLGGFFILFFLIASSFFTFKSDLLIIILLSSIPLFSVAFVEDLLQLGKPIYRLMAIIISIILFFILSRIDLPHIDPAAFNLLLDIGPLRYLFFIFSVTVIVNGINLNDGMNGLATLTVLFQFLSLFYLALTFNDNDFMMMVSLCIIPIFIFLLFNFPFGKLFLGDSGAYLLAFISALLTLVLFSRHPSIFSWTAILILFYPSMELLFSFIRKKIFYKMSPFSPDDQHLHTLIYKYLLNIKFGKKVANNLTTCILSPLYILPFIFIYFFSNEIMIILSILFLSLLYLCYYGVFYKINIINFKL